MTQELKEKIAKNAASTWCRCFKCDKTVIDIDEDEDVLLYALENLV